MLSRKVFCVWMVLALPLVALVAAGVSLGQDTSPPKPVPSAELNPSVPASSDAPRAETLLLEAPKASAGPTPIASPPGAKQPGSPPQTSAPLRPLPPAATYRPRATSSMRHEVAVTQLEEAQAQFRKAQRLLREAQARIQSETMEWSLAPGRRVSIHDQPAPEHHDPEMAAFLKQDSDCEEAAGKLAEQCRKETDKQKRADLKKGLTELTEKHFAVRQQRRQLQIAQLEAELEKVRATIEKRNDARDLIIRRRVSTLLGKRDILDWGPPAASPGRSPRAVQEFR